MQWLHLSYVRIDYSQVRVLENPGYDFVFRPPEPSQGYEGGLDDMEDWDPIFVLYFFMYYFFYYIFISFQFNVFYFIFISISYQYEQCLFYLKVLIL